MYDNENDSWNTGEDAGEECGARHNCAICHSPVVSGLLSQDGEALCPDCAGSLGVDELLMLCDCANVEELLVSLGYSEL